MKLFLFIITLFSIGRCIAAEEDDAYSNSDTEVYHEVTDDPLEESEETIHEDENASEDPLEESEVENAHGFENTQEAFSSLSNEHALKDESSVQERRDKKKKKIRPMLKDEIKRFMEEVQLGEKAFFINENPHVKQSKHYIDLGRRSAAQDLKNIAAENADYLTPEKAPPELVLLVAKESALLRSGKDTDQGSDFDRKKILRSGDYWNGVWKEEVKPKSAMRSASQKKKLIEPLRYEVAPEFRFIHYPSYSYYKGRRNEISPEQPQGSFRLPTRLPMQRRRL